MKRFADPILDEVYQARQKLVRQFGGARAYCQDVIRRSRERTARGVKFSGETRDVDNPGQGSKPWEDPIVKEIHEIREKLARKQPAKKAA
jgi:hypothetical protein